MTYDRPGGTPVLELDGVLVKLECPNPTGSIKDRIAAFLLDAALQRGDLRAGETVLAATTGNSGIALAYAARERGLAALLFVPENVDADRWRMMERLGARVRLTPAAEGLEGALSRRDAHQAAHGGHVPDMRGHPGIPRCHELGTGAEFVAQLRGRGVQCLDFFVCGVGTGGTLRGVGAALRGAWPAVRLVAVEPAEAPVFGDDAEGPHGIPGISEGVPPPHLERAAVDLVVAVSTEEAHARAVRLRRAHGLCVGRSSGANFDAALRLAESGAVVATLFPDSADRYGGLGLYNASSPDVTCEHRAQCAARLHALLGPGALPVRRPDPAS